MRPCFTVSPEARTERVQLTRTCCSTTRETFTEQHPEGARTGYGVVFKLSPGESNWQESVLYNFAGGTDGANPGNGLIRDVAGNFYGTTQVGGAYGGGTVFELSPAGDGWTEQAL